MGDARGQHLGQPLFGFLPEIGERLRALGIDVLLEDVEHLPRPDEHHQPFERADARRERLRRLGELLVGDVLDALRGALHALGGGRLADARPQGDDRPVPDDQLHRTTGGDGRVSRLVRLRRRRRGEEDEEARRGVQPQRLR